MILGNLRSVTKIAGLTYCWPIGPITLLPVPGAGGRIPRPRPTPGPPGPEAPAGPPGPASALCECSLVHWSGVRTPRIPSKHLCVRLLKVGARIRDFIDLRRSLGGVERTGTQQRLKQHLLLLNVGMEVNQLKPALLKDVIHPLGLFRRQCQPSALQQDSSTTCPPGRCGTVRPWGRPEGHGIRLGHCRGRYP
jgi:hypothetical protein